MSENVAIALISKNLKTSSISMIFENRRAHKIDLPQQSCCLDRSIFARAGFAGSRRLSKSVLF